MTVDYLTALNDLRDGKIEELKITPSDFAAFQKGWSQFPYQNTVRGIAHRGGHITYIRSK
ncbi:hypothetical protein [Convivina praedatoris]|uniref:Uncharacterized protein n=1 Tax=Convivina praedatoris TaxID=2880963 RepID=A0ABN8HEB3_9LACO|nr:hypothetical protein [Convivina sp. LMG 32447]CAH1854026.1 hypothetical protein R077815_00950 [Convivina sp. LMG 32447]CAH1855309.1 hypothetical protein R078138_01085 [Convivina sp. LMG 32447]CAH1855387.1 hypothetical protein LMG032447_01064 [Convivina sp. LMG 32447]